MGSSSFSPSPGCLRNLLSKHRPDQRPHQVGRAVDQVGLVDAVDQHEDSFEVHRAEHALELGQQLVAVVGALPGGQRLADDLAAGKVQQHPAEQVRIAVEHAGVAADPPGLAPPLQQSPAARRPAGGDQHVRQPVAEPGPIAAAKRRKPTTATVASRPKARSHFDRQVGNRSFCRRRRQRWNRFSAVDWS